MTDIKILGTGCPKCKQTMNMVEQAVSEMGREDVQIEKVEDIMEIMQYNVMTTPALVIDGQVKVKGRVPSVEEVKALLA